MTECSDSYKQASSEGEGGVEGEEYSHRKLPSVYM
jgi:hypothetical protein